MEEFSQSRGDDDLFDDEIVPIKPTPQRVEKVTEQIEQISLEPPPNNPAPEPEVAQTTSNQRGRGRGKARGRGGQPREQKSGGLAESKYAPKATNTRTEPAKPVAAETEVAQSKEGSSQHSAQDEDSAAPAASTGPSSSAPSRPPAVRGDRTATGGVRKPKLTEEELSAKLAAAKERSQNLAAAHARAQADAESFAERERMATVKRAKENEDRKALEGEREKNRERKLRALGGREWDAGKDEHDQSRVAGPRRQGDFNEEENDLSMYEWREDRGRGRGRGRARAGRGGRGRGNARNEGRGLSQAQPDLSAEAEFPALPVKKDNSVAKKPTPARKDSEPVMGSWADQVESSEAAKA